MCKYCLGVRSVDSKVYLGLNARTIKVKVVSAVQQRFNVNRNKNCCHYDDELLGSVTTRSLLNRGVGLNIQGRSPTHKDRELVGCRPTDIISKLIIRCLITCQKLTIFVCNIISCDYSNSLLINDSVLTLSYIQVHLVNQPRV